MGSVSGGLIDHLVSWGMGFRLGIVVKADSNGFGNIRKHSLTKF